MKIKRMVASVVLALVSVKSFAVHVDMKPGLWEETFKLDESDATPEAAQQRQMLQLGAEMAKRFGDMPPEQRKQIEQMMARQGMDISGLDMGGQNMQISKEGTVVKTCITQADIDKGQLPSPEKSCASHIVQVSSHVYKATYQCQGENASQGVSEVTFQNQKSFTGKVSYSPGGVAKGQVIQGDMTGKWLASDCGNIAPISQQMNADK